MFKSNWTPSIVPAGDDNQTVYLVADDYGKIGRAWREADYESTDLETVIQDLLSGQYNNPIRVVAFNTEERWSEDVSEDVAHELRRRCDLQLRDVPTSIRDFVERHEGHAWRQLTLRLVYTPVLRAARLNGRVMHIPTANIQRPPEVCMDANEAANSIARIGTYSSTSDHPTARPRWLC